jgi:hypothetical protein
MVKLHLKPICHRAFQLGKHSELTDDPHPIPPMYLLLAHVSSRVRLGHGTKPSLLNVTISSWNLFF